MQVLGGGTHKGKSWRPHLARTQDKIASRLKCSSVVEASCLTFSTSCYAGAGRRNSQRQVMEASSGKDPGQDCVPADVFKCGGSQLLDILHQLLCLCWEEGSVPQEMRDSTIITLYKNKSDHSDRKNYRVISLL